MLVVGPVHWLGLFRVFRGSISLVLALGRSLNNCLKGICVSVCKVNLGLA